MYVKSADSATEMSHSKSKDNVVFLEVKIKLESKEI